MFGLGGLGIVPGHHVLGEQLQRFLVAPRRKELKRSHADVTLRNAGQHRAR